jgi:hypothetical protein
MLSLVIKELQERKYFFEDRSFENYAGNTTAGEPKQGALVSGIGAFR